MTAAARLTLAAWQLTPDSNKTLTNPAAKAALNANVKLGMLCGRIETFCDEPAAAAIEQFHERFAKLSQLKDKTTDNTQITMMIDVIRALEVALQEEARRDFNEL